MAALSNGLALWVRRQEIVIAVMNFVLLPMIYLSSMLMATKLMPGWISAASKYNPVNWGVLAARAGFEGMSMRVILPPLLGLWVFATVCIAVATLAFRNYRNSI